MAIALRNRRDLKTRRHRFGGFGRYGRPAPFESTNGNGAVHVNGNGCRHHWLIETPNGPTSLGICIECNARKRFPNAAEDAVLRPED